MSGKRGGGETVIKNHTRTHATHCLSTNTHTHHHYHRRRKRAKEEQDAAAAQSSAGGPSFAPVEIKKFIKIGRPGYKGWLGGTNCNQDAKTQPVARACGLFACTRPTVTKQAVPFTNQKSLLVQVDLPQIAAGVKPHYRLMSAFEQVGSLVPPIPCRESCCLHSQSRTHTPHTTPSAWRSRTRTSSTW